MKNSSTIITTVFAALLFFVLVFRLPTNPGEARVSFMLIMEIALTLALAAVIWQHSKLVSLFLVLSFISSQYPFAGIMSYFAQKMVFIGCLWYFLLVHFVDDFNPILDAMIYGALFCLLFQMVQLVFYYEGIEAYIGCPIPIGVMSNPNETASLYIFTLPAFCRNGRWEYLFFPAFGLLLTASKMAIASLFTAALVLLYYHCLYGKKYNYLSFALLISGMVSAIGVLTRAVYLPLDTYNSFSVRLHVLKISFPYLKKFWIMGKGLGHWKLMTLNKMPGVGSIWDFAHNEPYQAWAEMGIGAVILLALYIAHVFLTFNEKLIISTIALAMIATNITVIYSLHIAPLAMLVLTWMAKHTKDYERSRWVQVDGYPMFKERSSRQ